MPTYMLAHHPEFLSILSGPLRCPGGATRCVAEYPNGALPGKPARTFAKSLHGHFFPPLCHSKLSESHSLVESARQAVHTGRPLLNLVRESWQYARSQQQLLLMEQLLLMAKRQRASAMHSALQKKGRGLEHLVQLRGGALAPII
eukprot:5884664-Amphidinium_carterae.2